MAVKIIYFLLALTTLLPTLTSSAPQKFVNPYSVLSKPIVDDESFNFQMLIGLGLAQYGGADAAELLSAAQVVKPLSFPSWNQTFYDLAAKTQALAKSYKNPLNAQRTYFRAATYYRLADFYNHAVWSNPLINEYWVQQLACFDAAIATLPVPGLRVTLPADDFNTIGIFFSPAPPPVSGAPIKRPTIIIGNGYDAAQEDSFHQTGIAALARGWNVLVYEGPGQPTVRRQQNIGFVSETLESMFEFWTFFASLNPHPLLPTLAPSVTNSSHVITRAASPRHHHPHHHPQQANHQSLTNEPVQIYDWERVVTPAVDYLYSRPNVDTSRIALMGVSMGGYLAPRAAAFEPRINAVIADGGIYDLQQSFLQQYGPEVAAMFAAGNKTELDDTINQYVIANTSASSSMRWGVEQGRWSFKTHSSYVSDS